MPTMRFQLRPMADTDLEAVEDLWVAGWSDTLPEIDFEARRSWLEARLAWLAARGAVVTVAEDQRLGRVVGFVTLEPDSGHLDQLTVDPAVRAAGAAVQLINHAKAQAPGVIRLEVNVANPRAIRFYEREGFVRVGESISPSSGLPIYGYEWRTAPG
jgi:putative acetyltransferase